MENNKFNKLLNEKYYLLKDVAKKYDYKEELLDMITYVYVSFYMDFGKVVDLPLYDLFNQVRIIYEVGNVSEIAERNGFGNMSDGDAAVTIFTPNLKVFQDQSLKQNPQTILLGTHVNDHFATPTLKLEMVTHEIRHALMGYYNTNKLLDDITYYMRSGLQESFYTKDDTTKEGFILKQQGTILDEVLNTYISELLVNRIKSFSKYNIENGNLRGYLKTIKTSQPDGNYRSIGHHNDVKLFYPVLQQQMFINLVNQHQFDGDLDIIKDFIESITDKCSYNELCALLDNISMNNLNYEKAVANNDMDFINKHIKNICSAKDIIIDMQKNLVKK